MSWVYGVGYIASVAMGLLIVGKLVRLARGEFTDDDLIQVQDSEDTAAPHVQGAAR
jgi:TRAP-type C4-dicarboxylate transport system permease small subunit